MQYQGDPTDQTQENGLKPRFWLFASVKMAFSRFLNDPVWVIGWPTHAHHLVLSKYAIQSQSDVPNSRKWPITSFLAIWIIQKGIFLIFEWSSISDTSSKSCTLLSSIKICNIESIRCSELEKIAKNHMDHSKRLKGVDASHRIFL